MHMLRLLWQILLPHSPVRNYSNLFAAWQNSHDGLSLRRSHDEADDGFAHKS